MSDHLTSFRRGFRYAAIVCSVASALLTFSFGINQHPNWTLAFAVASFFVVCSLASDYIVLFVADAYRHCQRVRLALLGCGMAVVFSLNLVSNIGSIGWQRDTVTTEARVQNAKYDDRRSEVTESRTSVEMWKKRLADLEAQNPWLPTVTPEAMRAQLANANLAIEQEAKRGGCGPRCLARTKERDDIQSRIALAEEKITLTKQIEATKRILAAARDKAEKTKAVVAAPEAQSRFFASMMGVTLAPSVEAQTWTDRGLALFITIGLCVCPILFSFIGFRSEESLAPIPPTASAPITEPKTEPEPRAAQTTSDGLIVTLARLGEIANRKQVAA